jgi:bifunctional DNA-binding transcriptional regulator/antitoxin component of YhaV-PrlF toxin-antitoxin module
MAIPFERDGGKRFRAKVTGRHAITLPAELCRALDIQVGDTVEIQLQDDHAALRREAPRETPSARGILGGYFSSLDEIDQYVEEERRGWDDREDLLMEARGKSGQQR